MNTSDVIIAAGLMALFAVCFFYWYCLNSKDKSSTPTPEINPESSSVKKPKPLSLVEDANWSRIIRMIVYDLLDRRASLGLEIDPLSNLSNQYLFNTINSLKSIREINDCIETLSFKDDHFKQHRFNWFWLPSENVVGILYPVRINEKLSIVKLILTQNALIRVTEPVDSNDDSEELNEADGDNTSSEVPNFSEQDYLQMRLQLMALFTPSSGQVE